MGWHSDKLHSESQFISFGNFRSKSKLDQILPILCQYKNRFLYWRDDLVFSGCDLSPNYYSSETHGRLSPDPWLVITLLAELAFWPADRSHVIPSPVSQAKQLMLDPGHCSSPALLLGVSQLGFTAIEKSWRSVKTIKFFPNGIHRQQWRQCFPAMLFIANQTYNWSSRWEENQLILCF